jgi:hypothetical protein
VQPVRQLHQQHTNVAGDRQHQLAEIFRLLGALGEKFKLGQLGDAIDQSGNLFPEILLHIVIGDERVFDRVVQQRGDDSGDIEFELGEDRRHFQGVGEIRIARGAELLAMGGHGIDIGLIENGLVGTGIIRGDPLHQVGLAHQPPAPARHARCGDGRSVRGHYRNRAGDGRGTHAPII